MYFNLFLMSFILYIQNKASPNIGILLNGVLKHNYLIILLLLVFLINLDFLLPHIAHFDNNIALPLLVFETTGSIFSVFFFFFFYTFKNKMVLFYT